MIKNLPANAGSTDPIPGSGRSPGEENGNPLQYYCLENPTDRGAWQVTIPAVTESDTTERLRTSQHGSHYWVPLSSIMQILPGAQGFPQAH